MLDNIRRIFAVTSKEFRQLSRDRITFGMVVGIPLLQILLFGYAINLDVRHLQAGVVDLSNTSLSRAIVANAQASQLVDITLRASSEKSLEDALQRGEISVGIVLPTDLSRRIEEGQNPVGQLLIDGSDPTVANIAAQLARMPPLVRTGISDMPQASFTLRTYYNPEGRSAVNIVPALIGVILHMTMVLFTSMAIVRERERGNLELLITTPIKTPELMVGKILPYICIGLIQTSIILAAGSWLFDVPIQGSILQIYVATLIFIAATLSLGLVISTIASTQFQAMQLMIFTLLPSILLSGFMFPFDGMPKAAQWIAQVLPLTHFVRLVRGILLRGAELGDLWSSWSSLLLFFAVGMTIAVLRFHKRLD